MKRKMMALVSTPAVVLATYAATVAVSDQESGNRSNASDAGQVVALGQAATMADDPGVTPVPEAIEKGLAEFDVKVDPAQVATTQTLRTSVSEATAVARAGFGLGHAGIASTATLAHVTLGQYGRELEPDPSKPSRIEPEIRDRLAWVITFANAPVPIFGPSGYSGPKSTLQTVVAFVDPVSGEYLAGLAF